MNFVKKGLAAGMAMIMAGSMGACSIGADTNWVAKSGELTVPAGIYIWEMMNQYYEAQSTLGEDIKDPLKEKIEDVAVPEVIVKGAKEDLNGFIAIEKKFDELGFKLDEATKAGMAQNAQQYWEYIGASYEKNGIAQESYAMTFENDAKGRQIFQSIYGEGGSQAVSEKELKDKFLKDYAKILAIPLNLSTSEDAATKEASDKTARELIAKYEQKLKSGGNVEDIVYEARKEVSKDDTLQKPEAGTSFTFIARDTDQYPKELVDAVFAAKNGEPIKVEASDSIYLFVRYDVGENENDFVSRKAAILQQLKADEFSALITQWGTELKDVSYNDAAFKRYTPQKLKIS